mmetsp:Transcript_42264/g.106491  ORF Transcript_42264/g.106491 Transcript_42264/m.106491 type:complete len:514 (+) Transcript_42264:57-1598(+)
MASRPGSSWGDGIVGPRSTSNSVGVVSVSHSQRSDQSNIAGEVAEEMTSSMIDGVLGAPLPTIPAGAESFCTDARDDVAVLQAQNDQLQNEIKNVRNELEFASLKEDELEKRNQSAQLIVDDWRRKHAALQEQLHETQCELQRTKEQLAKQTCSGQHILHSGQPMDVEVLPSHDREAADKLRPRVSALEAELAERGKDVPSTQATMELAGEGSEDPPLLAAAYHQISVLNTQLAHLYTELTMARTEVQHLRSVQESEGHDQHTNSTLIPNGEVDAKKQSQQIADLVGDIRHLQLDLEYHQQKLDHMIEEKQKMMKDLKQCRSELAETRQLAEEREQMLRHRDVDLQHLKQELKCPRPADSDGGMVSALRTEAAAKDSALIVSHYELHKEKLLRDRLEQKNTKLMERMQKLMMVVETMRRENISLEKLVTAKDRANDAKELQLRQAMQKAKQLQKSQRAARSKTKAPSELPPTELQGLPPVDRQHRSVESGGGRQSGMSTPHTPRCPPSPYEFK